MHNRTTGCSNRAIKSQSKMQQSKKWKWYLTLEFFNLSRKENNCDHICLFPTTNSSDTLTHKTLDRYYESEVSGHLSQVLQGTIRQ